MLGPILHIKGESSAPNLEPKDPTRTVFAIMVSSLHKKWSCISRLLPCASISAERIFPIIKSCSIDIENCSLRVQIISTDNYPLNVNLFKFFSTSGKLKLGCLTHLRKFSKTGSSVNSIGLFPFQLKGRMSVRMSVWF